MNIFPAIDLFDKKAVRLFKGDYAQMTVYSENPEEVALDFKNSGATHIHLVDLEGAKSGETPNLETVVKIKKTTGLFCEIGGGIRSTEVIDRYISADIDRVILGTAAVTSNGFVEEAVAYIGWIFGSADVLQHGSHDVGLAGSGIPCRESCGDGAFTDAFNHCSHDH